MRRTLALAIAIWLVLGIAACSPGPSAGSSSGGTVTPTSSPKSVTQAVSPTATNTLAGSVARPTTAAATQTSAPGGAGLVEALTAQEAFAVADAKAKSVNPGYALSEVLGCHKAAAYGTVEKDSFLVEGHCVQWMFRYVRPIQEGSIKGYHELLVRAGPNGVLDSQEKLFDQQAYPKPSGVASAWKVDSTRAIEIAENAGGKAYRQKNPEWDTGRFESNKNAAIVARMEFTSYMNATVLKGKEIRGSQGAI